MYSSGKCSAPNTEKNLWWPGTGYCVNSFRFFFFASNFKNKFLPLLFSAVLGGIFGLCLGGSILSLFEFVYFFTYHLWLYRKKQRTNWKNAARQIPKRIMKPVVAPLTISKPALPELFQHEYRNILGKSSELNSSQNHISFEKYYP